jgi:hypothetical protein
VSGACCIRLVPTLIYAELHHFHDLKRRSAVALDADDRQIAEVSLTGQTVDEVLIEGFDSLDLSLSGRTLRQLLDDLAAGGGDLDRDQRTNPFPTTHSGCAECGGVLPARPANYAHPAPAKQRVTN